MALSDIRTGTRNDEAIATAVAAFRQVFGARFQTGEAILHGIHVSLRRRL